MEKNCFGDALYPCLWYVNAVASVVELGRADIPTFLAMEVPCAPLLRGIVGEDFLPWWGHGDLVVFERLV